MGIWTKIVNFFKPTKKVHVQLDPDSVKAHNLIRALANENAELKGEKAKLVSDLGKLRESTEDKEDEENVKYELNAQKKELELKKKMPYFSLKAFFNKIFKKKKYRDKLYFYSFDRGKRLAKFGDFGFSADGDFVLLDDKGREVMKMDNLKDIFQSVPALGNDIIDKKIPLNFTRDGEYVENPMVWEVPEITPTEDGKFRYAKARKKPFYDYLAELRAQMGHQQSYIEELELTNTKLQQKNDELSIAQRVSEDSAETSRTELSQAEKDVSAIKKVFRSTERELSQSRDINIVLEDNVDKLRLQLEEMRKEAEREGVKLNFDKALESLLNIRRELIKDEPSKEVRIVEKQAVMPPVQKK